MKKPSKKHAETPKLERWQWFGAILLIVSVAGFIGWLWEFILMEAKGGFSNLYVNGGNLLPWMNIYAYGAILILLTCFHLRKRPWAVFLVGALSTGLLEWLSGWLVYTIGNGTRYWDYSTSWIGVGNINGFVCPASVCVFGLGALLLMYVILPRCIALSQHMSKRAFLTLAIALFSVIVIDDVVNLVLKNLDKPTAQDFYINRGWVIFEK